MKSKPSSSRICVPKQRKGNGKLAMFTNMVCGIVYSSKVGSRNKIVFSVHTWEERITFIRLGLIFVSETGV